MSTLSPLTQASRGYLERRSVVARWGWVLVLLLHLLALGLLRELRRSEPLPASAQQTRVWLITLPLPSPKKRPDPTEIEAKAPRSSASPQAKRIAVSTLPLPINTANGTPTIAPSTTAVTAAQEPLPGPPGQAPARLNLNLPARAASGAQSTPAQMAARDPRSNSHRPDMGERMALALGSDPSLREEIINPGHRRIRQGSTCIDINDTRNSQLNPFDENARMGPKLTSKCKN